MATIYERAGRVDGRNGSITQIPVVTNTPRPPPSHRVSLAASRCRRVSESLPRSAAVFPSRCLAVPPRPRVSGPGPRVSVSRLERSRTCPAYLSLIRIFSWSCRTCFRVAASRCRPSWSCRTCARPSFVVAGSPAPPRLCRPWARQIPQITFLGPLLAQQTQADAWGTSRCLGHEQMPWGTSRCLEAPRARVCLCLSRLAAALFV